MPDSASAAPLPATVKPPAVPPLKNTVAPEPGQYALVVLENVKPVGADGAVPSIWSVSDWTVDAWPRLSTANHLIVRAAESWKFALAAFTVVAVPLVVGSLPSVV